MWQALLDEFLKHKNGFIVRVSIVAEQKKKFAK